MSSEFEKLAETEFISVNDSGDEKIRAHKLLKDEHAPVLVLVLGLNSNSLAWDDFLLYMNKSYSVYVIETREKKATITTNKTTFHQDNFASDIAKAINYWGLEHYILFASSMGAAFTLHALTKDLIKPDRIYLIGPVLRLEAPKFAIYAGMLITKCSWRFFLKPFAKFYIRNFHTQRDQKEQSEKYIGYLENVEPTRARKTTKGLKNFLITEDELRKIKRKCILIGAEKDKAHHASITRHIHSVLEDSEYYDLGDNISAHSLPLAQLAEELEEKYKKGETIGH